MACDKIYGLRRLFVAKETNGVPGTFYELRASSVELPKIFAEQTIIDEASGFRGDTAYVDGNLNELTGTITLSLPKDKNDFILSNAVEPLFHGAGFAKTTSVVPLNSGACANTFCIYTLDRTGQFAERLEGCIVTSIDFTLNRSDAPTVAFAFQAAKKYEFWGVKLCNAFDNTSGTVTTTTAGTFHCGIPSVSSLSSGEMPVLIAGYEKAYISAYDAEDGVTFTRPNASDQGEDVSVMPDVPSGAVEISDAIGYASNRAWTVLANGSTSELKIQSVSVTIETGMSYGELVVGHQYLSEVLVGGLNVTGSFTVYVDATAGATFNEVNGELQSYEIQIGNYEIIIPHLSFTEPPDLALAKNEPVSGDFAWKAYNGSSVFDLVSIAGV